MERDLRLPRCPFSEGTAQYMLWMRAEEADAEAADMDTRALDFEKRGEGARFRAGQCRAIAQVCREAIAKLGMA